MESKSLKLETLAACVKTAPDSDEFAYTIRKSREAMVGKAYFSPVSYTILQKPKSTSSRVLSLRSKFHQFL